MTYVNVIEGDVKCECHDYDWDLLQDGNPPIMTLRVFSGNRPKDAAPMALIVRGEKGFQIPFHMAQIQMLAALLENEEFLNDVASL